MGNGYYIFLPLTESVSTFHVIMDLFNNEIVAYQISERNNLKLVLDTVNKAVKKRKIHCPLLLHSDQGFQYTSKKYNQVLQKYNIKISMSRKGNCYDNACIESFFSHFKTECFYRYQFEEKDIAFFLH